MTGDQPAAVEGRQRMIEQYLPLARSLARRYRHGGEPIDDLEQTAYVGLESRPSTGSIRSAARSPPSRSRRP